MATQVPELKINILDTHSLGSLAILDASQYPISYTPISPFIEITPPGFDVITLAFTPSSLQLYTSSTLGISCEWCDDVDLPDGIWNVKYYNYPSYKYYVTKTFVRVDKLQAKIDKSYILLDFTQCDEAIKREDRLFLDTIQTFLEGAIAAGNKCVNATYISLYKKASVMLDNYINNKSCVRH